MATSLRKYISNRLMRAVLWSGIFAATGVIGSGSFLIERIVRTATEAAYREVENRFVVLDHVLARVERDSALTGHKALLKLASLYPTLDEAKAAGIEYLRGDAARLGISELYFISLDGVIEATSFKPDQDFNLFALGAEFREFLLGVAGAGRFADQRLSMSTNTSQVNSYQYFGPPGADYILEVSTRLDESIPRTFPGLTLGELLKLLLHSGSGSKSALVHVSDFIWGKNEPFRSFITQEPVEARVSELIAKAATDGTASTSAGLRQTIVRTLSLSDRNFDYSDRYTFMVLEADRTPILEFALVSATVALVLIAAAIKGSYHLSKGSFEHNVTSRIEILETAMARIGSGDAAARLDDGGGDEIAGIGRRAEAMVAQIRERNAELSALARELEEEAVESARREKSLAETLDANQALVHEIDHRVKNNLQVAISLASMQSRTAKSEETRIALDRMRIRLAIMAMVQDQALRFPDSPIVDMDQFLQDVAANVAASHPDGLSRIERRISSADCLFTPDRAVALGLAAAELIDNAYRHAFASADSGVLTVTLDDDGCAGSFVLVVADNGKGTPQPGGVGLEIVEALAAQLGGSVSWTSDSGTRVELRASPKA